MTAPRYAPYAEPAANDIYHLLFCDDAAAFAALGQPQSAEDARATAADTAKDSRERMLACNWLRTHGYAVADKGLFGVIVEMALDDGLDTLAAYADGSVRYINHTGRMSIVEGPLPALAPAIDKLFAESRKVVASIGPWDRDRLPPPKRGQARLTLLVADGLYVGEGPRRMFERDGLAGPVLTAATKLLVRVVDLSQQ